MSYIKRQFEKDIQQLLPAEVAAKLPPLYAGEDLGLNALAQVKYFTPRSNWTWYASEFDGEDTFFGLVSGFEIELGYFSLSEFVSCRDNFGLIPVERDFSFKPATLRELKAYEEKIREGYAR